MDKSQHSHAKPQRSDEISRKADQKRERRAQVNQEAAEFCEPLQSQVSLSLAEHAVLSVFRTYLMTPGKMLCLRRSDVETLDRALAQLTDKGLLVAERFQGGYSLTKTGFAAMKQSE